MKKSESQENINSGIIPSGDSGKYWLSAHFFYHEPFEGLLQHVVRPLVATLKGEGVISKFFFIRYWEGGPHIRLRLLGDRNVLINEVFPVVCNQYKQFIQRYPSSGSSHTSHDGLYPADSLRLITYEPETERYGGLHALPIAENQFDASSTAVLHCMNRDHPWTARQALGAAIQFHVSFAYASGIKVSEAIDFFNWLTHVQMKFASRLLHTGVKKFRENTDDAFLVYFEEKFQQQQDSLYDFGTALWQALRDNSCFDKEWLNDWIKDSRSITDRLKDLHRSNKIHRAPIQIPGAGDSSLLYIYSSFIHMTNNRLGISNSDEPYIAFLLSKIFLELRRQGLN